MSELWEGAAVAAQTLLIDADDTLWENNIYFEQVFEEFVRLVDHPQLSAGQIRAVLDEIECANRVTHGYGALSFAHNLRQCYERLIGSPPQAGASSAIEAMTRRIFEQPIQLLPGVAETLPYLARRHQLILFTKGQPDEQRGKIERSGLACYFRHSAVVREKDAAAYRGLVRELDLAPASVWMIGNSPRSDINPALEVGLNAVYIPHPRTWSLEHEPIRNGRGRLLVLESFSQLRHYF